MYLNVQRLREFSEHSVVKSLPPTTDLSRGEMFCSQECIAYILVYVCDILCILHCLTALYWFEDSPLKECILLKYLADNTIVQGDFGISMREGRVGGCFSY